MSAAAVLETRFSKNALRPVSATAACGKSASVITQEPSQGITRQQTIVFAVTLILLLIGAHFIPAGIGNVSDPISSRNTLSHPAVEPMEYEAGQSIMVVRC
jgi:hypothetical protein